MIALQCRLQAAYPAAWPCRKGLRTDLNLTAKEGASGLWRRAAATRLPEVRITMRLHEQAGEPEFDVCI